MAPNGKRLLQKSTVEVLTKKRIRGIECSNNLATAFGVNGDAAPIPQSFMLGEYYRRSLPIHLDFFPFHLAHWCAMTARVHVRTCIPKLSCISHSNYLRACSEHTLNSACTLTHTYVVIYCHSPPPAHLLSRMMPSPKQTNQTNGKGWAIKHLDGDIDDINPQMQSCECEWSGYANNRGTFYPDEEAYVLVFPQVMVPSPGGFNISGTIAEARAKITALWN